MDQEAGILSSYMTCGVISLKGKNDSEAEAKWIHGLKEADGTEMEMYGKEKWPDSKTDTQSISQAG